ncbi:MAG: hypothetical protein V4494_06550 [Chlamydiota bacterium]
MCDSVSNACNAVGQFGGQACKKIGEWGGSASRWIVDNGSAAASKIGTFIKNVIWPSVKQFGAWLGSLAKSTAEVAKTHPKEFGAVAITGVVALIVAIAGILCCKTMSNKTQQPVNAPVNNNNAPRRA